MANIAASLFFAFTLFGCFSIALAQSFPSAKEVAELGRKTSFGKEAVGKEPVAAEVTAMNPKFRMLVYFASEDPIQLSKKRTGAVAAKLDVAGIPEEAGLPDGTYYLWIGVVGGNLHSLLVREDASKAQELLVLDEPMSVEKLRAMRQSHQARVHAGWTTAALPLPGTPPLPPGGVHPPPRPQPSYRWICHNVCGTDHGGTCHWVTTVVRDN